jgi:PleD family two-component response regulator
VAVLEEHDDAEHLVEKADHSLYRAKALGRNRIATFEESGARPATDR